MDITTDGQRLKMNKKRLKLLVGTCFDIDELLSTGETLLHVAVKKNFKDIVQLLIDNHASIDIKDKLEELTPLFYAIKKNNIDIAKILIENGADINTKDRYHVSPIHFVVENYYIDMLKLLIEKGVDINDNYRRRRYVPLHIAVYKGNFNIVQLLIDNHACLNVKNDDGDTALHHALKYKQPDIAKLLIENDIDLSMKNSSLDTYLHCAIYYRYSDIARILIEKGVDIDAINSYKYTPLIFAIKERNIDIARLLIAKNAKTYITTGYLCETALHKAIYYGNISIIKLLVEKSIDINIKNKEGDTYLHYAVYKGRKDIEQLLIDNGADKTIKNNDGFVPSMIKYKKPIYKELLDNLISFISNIVTRRIVGGKLKLRFKPITLYGVSNGLFSRYSNTSGSIYHNELWDICKKLGYRSEKLTKRMCCVFIARKIEHYITLKRCNIDNIKRKSITLHNDVDFLHEPIETISELYILLDTNGRYYGFSRDDYSYLKNHRKNPHSTSDLADNQIKDMTIFFENFDREEYDFYRSLLN